MDGDLTLVFKYDFTTTHTEDTWTIDSITCALDYTLPTGICATMSDVEAACMQAESVCFQKVWCHEEVASLIRRVMTRSTMLRRLAVRCERVDFKQGEVPHGTEDEPTYTLTRDDSVYYAISEGLKNSRSLRVLCIAGMCLDPRDRMYWENKEAVKWDVSFLVEGLSAVDSTLRMLYMWLVQLSLEDVDSLACAIANGNVLSGLALKSCLIDDVSAHILALRLRGCTSLYGLCVDDNCIDDAGATALADLCLSRLQIRRNFTTAEFSNFVAKRRELLYDDCVVSCDEGRGAQWIVDCEILDSIRSQIFDPALLFYTILPPYVILLIAEHLMAELATDEGRGIEKRYGRPCPSVSHYFHLLQTRYHSENIKRILSIHHSIRDVRNNSLRDVDSKSSR